MPISPLRRACATALRYELFAFDTPDTPLLAPLLAEYASMPDAFMLAPLPLTLLRHVFCCLRCERYVMPLRAEDEGAREESVTPMLRLLLMAASGVADARWRRGSAALRIADERSAAERAHSASVRLSIVRLRSRCYGCQPLQQAQVCARHAVSVLQRVYGSSMPRATARGVERAAAQRRKKSVRRPYVMLDVVDALVMLPTLHIRCLRATATPSLLLVAIRNDMLDCHFATRRRRHLPMPRRPPRRRLFRRLADY